MTFDEELSSVLEGETVDALGRGDHGHSRRDGLEQATPGLRAKALGSHGHRRSPQEAPEATDRCRHLDAGEAGETPGERKERLAADEELGARHPRVDARKNLVAELRGGPRLALPVQTGIKGDDRGATGAEMRRGLIEIDAFRITVTEAAGAKEATRRAASGVVTSERVACRAPVTSTTRSRSASASYTRALRPENRRERSRHHSESRSPKSTTTGTAGTRSSAYGIMLVEVT